MNDKNLKRKEEENNLKEFGNPIEEEGKADIIYIYIYNVKKKINLYLNLNC